MPKRTPLVEAHLENLGSAALERYAEKKLHKKPLAETSRNDSGAQGGSGGQQRGKQLLTMAANSLLGIAGLGATGFGGGPFGQPGMMGPGRMMGQGMMGPGMGRMRARQGAAQERPAQGEPAPMHVEDPAIYAPIPPPPGAKILTRVAWCEVQVFGQTHPELHLPERLGQLNRQINFAPSKSDLELMDDVPALIKAVQAQRRTPTSLTSAAAPAPAAR